MFPYKSVSKWANFEPSSLTSHLLSRIWGLLNKDLLSHPQSPMVTFKFMALPFCPTYLKNLICDGVKWYQKHIGPLHHPLSDVTTCSLWAEIAIWDRFVHNYHACNIRGPALNASAFSLQKRSACRDWGNHSIAAERRGRRGILGNKRGGEEKARIQSMWLSHCMFIMDELVKLVEQSSSASTSP